MKYDGISPLLLDSCNVEIFFQKHLKGRLSKCFLIAECLHGDVVEVDRRVPEAIGRGRAADELYIPGRELLDAGLRCGPDAVLDVGLHDAIAHHLIAIELVERVQPRNAVSPAFDVVVARQFFRFPISQSILKKYSIQLKGEG